MAPWAKEHSVYSTNNPALARKHPQNVLGLVAQVCG